MNADNTCFFCGIECETQTVPLHHLLKQYTCDNCGNYILPKQCDFEASDPSLRFKMACLLNERRLRGLGGITLTEKATDKKDICGLPIVRVADVLSNFPYKISDFTVRSLLNLSRLVKQPFEHVELDLEPVGKYNLFSREGQDAHLFLRELQSQGYVSSWGDSNCWEFWSFALTTKCWDMIEGLNEITVDLNNAEVKHEHCNMIKVLISHSSKDKQLAEAIINLLIKGLSLSPREIRCTSIDGYRLPCGVKTDEQLRREVCSCEVLLGVISLYALDSLYVLFELGARWGAGGHLLPLLAPGVSPEILKGPLSAFNALSCNNASQLHQLIEDLSKCLGISANSPAVYQKDIDIVSSIASSPREYQDSNLLLLQGNVENHLEDAPQDNIKLSNEAQQLLLNAAKKNGTIHDMSEILTRGRSVEDVRKASEFKDNLEQLVTNGLIVYVKGIVYRVTRKGFLLADKWSENNTNANSAH